MARIAKQLSVPFIAPLVIACLMGSTAMATCSTPTGNPGDVIFSSTSNQMAYCNGTNWISMGSSSNTSFGTLTSGDFCTATSSTAVACTTATINLSSQVSGTLQAAQMPALTGDITNTAGSFATTIGSIGGKTITLGSSFTTSGAFPLTLTTTASTNVTLPTSGTLITSAVTSLPSLISVGTVTTGTWNGTVVGATYGGTGINNGTNTITLGGNLATAGAFATSGAFPLTLTTTASTSVTLPTTGTLLSTTSSIGTSQITGILPVANGGTGAATLTGYLVGIGTSAITASTTIPESALTALAANQLLGSLTAVAPSGQSVPSCSTSSSGLQWTSGTGFACNTTINAATLGGATFAAPGSIGGTTAGSGTFTTLSASSTVSGTGFSTYLASPPAIGGTAAAAGNFTTLGASGAINDSQSIAATSTDGLLLTNPTVATTGNQKWSPRIHFDGHGWETGTGASQAVDFIEELQPTQSTTGAATGNLVWSNSINGGSYNPLLTLTSGGNVGIGTTNPTDTLYLYSTANAAGLAVDGTTNPTIIFYSGGTQRGNIGTPTSAGTFGTNNAAGDLVVRSQSNLDFAVGAGGTTAMYMTSAGNVGIGTTGPLTALNIWGSNNVGASSEATYHGTIEINDNGGNSATAGIGGLEFKSSVSGSGYGWRIVAPDLLNGNTPLIFNYRAAASAWSEAMRITNSGYVGIGTTAPTNFVGISTSTQYKGLAINNGTNDIVQLIGQGTGNDNGNLTLLNGGAAKVQLLANGNSYFNGGNVGIGTTNPQFPLDVVNQIFSRNATKDNEIYLSPSDYTTGSVLQAGNNANSAQKSLLLNPNGGYVGIGTPSPNQNLHIYGSNVFQLRLEQSSSSSRKSEMDFYNAGNFNWAIGNDIGGNNTQDFYIYDGRSSAVRLWIDSYGDVGLGGTQSPKAMLDIEGTGGTNYTYPTNFEYMNTSGQGGPCCSGQSLGISMYATGRVVSAAEFDAVSDRRKKENIVDISSSVATAFMDKVKPVQFTWKATPTDGLKYGFIAQDIIKAGFGNLVSILPDSNMPETKDRDGFISPKGGAFDLSYEAIIPILVKAAQDQAETTRQLGSQLNTDHNDIAALKAANDDLRATNAAEIRDLREKFEAYRKAHP